MKITNGTSHEINFYRVGVTLPVQGGRKLVLQEGAKPCLTVPPGTNLNAQVSNLEAPEIPGCEIPLKGAVVFTGYDPVPDGDIVIVSNLYRSAVKELGGDTSRLATVSGTVYASADGKRPCGCVELAVG